MTSEERREARYRRRQKRRQQNRQARSDALGPIEVVFSYHDMFFYGKKCCNGVRWKQSTQNFERHLFSGTATRRRAVLNGTWKPKKYVHFTITERGKVRPIDAPHISDRQLHKTLTQNVLVPLYTPSMIYDNGASQKGKGLHFHFKRLADQLRQHFRKYGRTGVITLLDLMGFFPSAPHSELYRRHFFLILNDSIRAIADQVVGTVPGGYGMPLGVEPSQQEMVALPSSVDNYIKCQLQVEAAGHYMDDYAMAFETLERAERTGAVVCGKFEGMELHVNPAKCKTIPLDKPFKFCKATFRMTETGRVIINGNRGSAKRARRKLRSFHKKVLAGEKSAEAVAEWMECQISYFENYNDHGRVLRLRRLYYALFIKGMEQQEGNHV